MKYLLSLATLFCLATPSFVSAQFTVNLDPGTARFTYFAPPEGPGIAGGVPHSFELHFGMQGSFTIEELPNGQGGVTEGTFTLVGNEGLLQSDPERWAGLQELARFRLLESMFSVEHGPPPDRTVFRAEFDDSFEDDLVLEFFRDTLVRMEGGPDYRAFDGNGSEYTYPIPEPEGLAWAVAACFWAGLWIGIRKVR